jgi:hypothetical protein
MSVNIGSDGDAISPPQSDENQTPTNDQSKQYSIPDGPADRHLSGIGYWTKSYFQEAEGTRTGLEQTAQ